MDYSIAELKEISTHAVKSNLFGMPSQEAAFSLMLVCQSEGLHPVQALRRFHIINGRPAMRADAMQAAFMQSGGKIVWKQRDDIACEATFSHPQGCEVTVRWTMEMAKAAGLTNNTNWKKYPRQMLHARCVSEGVRSSNPAIVCGFYTPEEVSDFDTKPAKATKAPKEPEPTKVEVIKAAEPKKAEEPKAIEATSVAEVIKAEPVAEAVKTFEAEVVKVEEVKAEEPKTSAQTLGSVIADKIRKARSKAMEFGCRTREDLQHFTEVCIGRPSENLTSLSEAELDQIINFKEN